MLNSSEYNLILGWEYIFILGWKTKKKHPSLSYANGIISKLIISYRKNMLIYSPFPSHEYACTPFLPVKL